MKRIDFFMSQAVEDDFLSLLEKQHFITRKNIAYTKLPTVMGRGQTNPKMGDSVWPQLNCSYIIYCDDEDTDGFKGIVAKIREMYPNEGTAAFLSDATVL